MYLDVEKEVREMQKATKRICRSRKSARKFLVDAGIYTKSGKLTKHYR